MTNQISHFAFILSTCHWKIIPGATTDCRDKMKIYDVAQRFLNAVMPGFWFPSRCHLARCLAPEKNKPGQCGGAWVESASDKHHGKVEHLQINQTCLQTSINSFQNGLPEKMIENDSNL